MTISLGEIDTQKVPQIIWTDDEEVLEDIYTSNGKIIKREKNIRLVVQY